MKHHTSMISCGPEERQGITCQQQVVVVCMVEQPLSYCLLTIALKSGRGTKLDSTSFWHVSDWNPSQYRENRGKSQISSLADGSENGGIHKPSTVPGELKHSTMGYLWLVTPQLLWISSPLTSPILCFFYSSWLLGILEIWNVPNISQKQGNHGK